MQLQKNCLFVTLVTKQIPMKQVLQKKTLAAQPNRIDNYYDKYNTVILDTTKRHTL